MNYELRKPIARYEYAGKQINAIGTDLGGWMKQQKAIGPSLS
jgi:hypothetical protein